MNHFWILSSYLVMDKHNLSVNLLTLAQQFSTASILRYAIRRLTIILGCLQLIGQTIFRFTTANQLPLFQQQKIALTGTELLGVPLFATLGLHVAIPNKMRQLSAIVEGEKTSGPFFCFANQEGEVQTLRLDL